jgi:hypothetical protein
VTGNDKVARSADDTSVREAQATADEQGLLFDDELAPVAADVGYRGRVQRRGHHLPAA